MLYCGYTTELARREQEHNQGIGSKFTRSRRPVRMVYAESFSTKSEAMKRECEIKKLSRADKLKLIDDKFSVEEFENTTREGIEKK